MAKGKLGSLPPITKAENKLAVFDPAGNVAMSVVPTFPATGVSFANHSDNYVRVQVTVAAVVVPLLLAPNSSDHLNYAVGVIGNINLVAVAKPVKSGGGVIDASATATVAQALDGYVDIKLISDQ